jgi:hypothetical protein
LPCSAQQVERGPRRGNRDDPERRCGADRQRNGVRFVGAETGQDPITFTVSRTSSVGTLAVSLVWGGSAAFSSDYTISVTGGTLSADRSTLTFASGAASATLTVKPVDDSAVEATETVTLAIAAGTGYIVGTPSSVSGSIVDNDKPSLSVSDATITEGNVGSATVTLTVTLSAVYSGTVTGLVRDRCRHRHSRQRLHGRLRHAHLLAGPGVQDRDHRGPGDRTRESNETFTLQLSNPSGATIAKGIGTVTIVDNDGALTASAAAPAGMSSSLTHSALDAAVSSAKAEWLSADPDADFSAVTFSIGDLPELQLGFTDGLAITIDATAAGWGWGTSGMDLLTVVMHELGHALGLDHEDVGLMADVLAPSETLALAARVRTAEIAPSARSEVKLTRASLPTRIEGTSRPQLIRAPASRPLRTHSAKTIRTGTSRRAR